MACYDQEFGSRLIADGFTFFGSMSLLEGVSADSWGRLIGEEIQYIPQNDVFVFQCNLHLVLQ